MDWSSHDYTQTYADTFVLPEDDSDAGLHVLNEPGPTPKRSWSSPEDTADLYARARVPIRPYRAPTRAGRRERFYIGGSDRENNPAVFNAAWDERPLRYNPNAGAGWAELVPPYRDRPYGGGPAPSRAYPPWTSSEGQVAPQELFTGSANAGAGAFAGCGVATAGLVLLVAVVVLLALTLAAAGRLEKELAVAVRAALAALSGRAPGGLAAA
jgi:hypothetical protein